MVLPHPPWPLFTAPRVPEEPGADEPRVPEESSGLSLLHQESRRRATLATVLEQELPALVELRLEQEQVGGSPRRPLLVEPRQDACFSC